MTSLMFRDPVDFEIQKDISPTDETVLINVTSNFIPT